MKRHTKLAKFAAKRIATSLGTAVLSVTNPDTAPNRQRGANRFRDTMFEELCKALIIGINPEHESWASQIKVFWNPRMRSTAGIARYQEMSICLNPKLWHISTVEVQRALRHELAHLLAWKTRNRKGTFTNHGQEWKDACTALGIKGEKVYHHFPQIKATRQAPKYKYTCPHCNTSLYRVRPVSHKRLIACIACCKKYNGGAYAPVYRFKLSEVLAPKT